MQNMMKEVGRIVALLFLLPVALQAQAVAGAPALASPIPIKVVVVTMFQRGEDTGDPPGEFQFWVEREHLDQVLPLPAGYHHVRLNKDGVLGMLTGVGTAKAAASVMALGLDPRFDLIEGLLDRRGHRRRRSRGRLARLGRLGRACHRRRPRLRNRRARNSTRLAHRLRSTAQDHALRAARVPQRNSKAKCTRSTPGLVTGPFT